jgi:hypothetical protein
MRVLALALVAIFGLATASAGACPTSSAADDQSLAASGSQTGNTPVPPREDREG